MSLQSDANDLERRVAEQAARGQAPSGADKVEAAGLMLQAVGVIIMCVVGLVILGALLYACAA